MKIVTWNVNSIKARLENCLEWVNENYPDVILLQELKCKTEAFPYSFFEELGYQCAVFGQPTYNGVAILSKVGIEDVTVGNEFFQEDTQARVIEAIVGGNIRVISVYVPNGQALGSEKYQYKLSFMEKFERLVAARLGYGESLVIGGDFNVAPLDKDVYDPALFKDDILCSFEERVRFRSLINLGLTDVLRHHHPNESELYTWWDYRGGAFSKNHGLRIDHFLVSSKALEVVSNCYVDATPRGKEKPSDHAPVIIELSCFS